MDLETSVLSSALKFVSGENSHVCRLCFASTVGQEFDLQDSIRIQRSYHDETISFVEMFEELGVPEEKYLPQVLCVDCANTAVNSYLFQQLSRYSNEKWTKAFQCIERTLNQTQAISPLVKTAYILINSEESSILTSRKTLSQHTRSAALVKIKSIANNRTKCELKKRSHQCKKCGDKFDSKVLLNRHMKSHYRSNDYSQQSCPQCARLFNTKLQLECHAERVHYPKTIVCTKCPKMFASERMLKHHEKMDHMAAICKLCFVQFASKSLLKTHLDKHDINKCDQCGKNFLNKHSFKMHAKTCGNVDSKVPAYFCDICKKGYVRKNSLRTHLKIDHGFGRLLTCPWCPKKFDAISRLRNHVVKHTRERNFFCDQCDGRFVTQAALVYHRRLHTGERPFPCDMCNESFLSASRRMEHKRRKHFEPTKECPLCHVKFVTGYQLKKHVQRHYNPQSKLYVPSETKSTLEDDIFGLQ